MPLKKEKPGEQEGLGDVGEEEVSLVFRSIHAI